MRAAEPALLTYGVMSEHIRPSAEGPDRQLLESVYPDENLFELPDLEHSEFDRRLRSMAWPKAPTGVKERVLNAVLKQADVDGIGISASPESSIRETQDLTTASEQVHRHELSRRRLEILSDRVMRAPRRQPRFATVL